MIPPITAAISTPKAPTPPRSSVAGGPENVEEPDGLDVDADVVVGLDADGLLPAGPDVALDVGPFDPGFVDAELADAVFGAGDAVAPGVLDVVVPAVFAPEVVLAVADDAAVVLLFEPSALEEVAVPGFAAPALVVSGLEPAGFLSVEDGLPVFGTLEAELPALELPGFSFTFSALRSIVTGRLDPVLPAPALPAPVLPAPVLPEGFAVLPGLSEEPVPFPPEEDFPPEDFLSVAICSPPEPSGHSLYTPLGEAVPQRHDFCALQNNDSTGLG